MSLYSPSIEKLIENFERLPSIGHKTAIRLAYHMLDMNEQEIAEFTNAITEAKQKLKYCSICYNISDTDPCPICSNPKRDPSTICVVEDVRDIMAMERTNEYKGVYHVLHGTISPMNGIGPDDIKIKELLQKYEAKITAAKLLGLRQKGVTGNFAQYDSINFGKDFDECHKGYYTNSFHVPVNMNISYKDKIAIEGKFHRFCNGGAITYVELKEMPGRNVEAVQEIIEYAYKNDCNYIGINFPMDNCLDCGYTGRIWGQCPWCKSVKIRRLRRVSGYLSEEDSFTTGKRKELNERKFHMAIDSMGVDRHCCI